MNLRAGIEFTLSTNLNTADFPLLLLAMFAGGAVAAAVYAATVWLLSLAAEKPHF